MDSVNIVRGEVNIVRGEVNELGDWTKNGNSQRNSSLNQELKSPDISI